MSTRQTVIGKTPRVNTNTGPSVYTQPLKTGVTGGSNDDADAFDASVISANAASGTTRQNYQADERIFSQGDQADAVFYIQSGKVKLTVDSPTGKQVVLATLPATSFFGEGCLVGQALRTSSASAMQASTVIRVTIEAMSTLLQQKPLFAERFRNYLFSRNIQVEAEWSDLVAREDNTILCIDDEPGGLNVRKAILQKQGFEVLTAPSGPAGLELFAANPVEAVVLDYAMPGMDGGQVAAELKRLNPDIKILMLSAYVDFPEETLQCVDKQSLKGESPTAFLEDLEQLLSC